MHAVHEFNVASGWCDSDTQAESLESSLRRTKRTIRELAACNQWDLFVTLTLAPGKWNRMDPLGIQAYIKEQAKKWRRKGCDYAYLFVPEAHKDGAVHLHGLVRGTPVEYLQAYTMDDVNSMPLPVAIVDTVNAGEDIYHCTIWDAEVGYNTLTPVRDLAKTASYITKYITKDLGSLPVKSRLWHSRGLQKAERLGVYQIPDNGVDNALQFLKAAASTTAKGIPLYTEYRDLPANNSTGRFRSASAFVDKKDMDREVILEYLNDNYERIGGEGELYEFGKEQAEF